MKINTSLLLVALLVTLLSACGTTVFARPSTAEVTAMQSKSTPLSIPIGSPSPTSFQPVPPTETPTPGPTNTPTPTPTATSTSTPLPSPTPTWESFEAGKLQVPILLYHHVSDDYPGNRYYVPVDQFREQMKNLHDWGYNTITLTQMVNVLLNGGSLPPKPLVITFDDGNLDIYQNAYPIMKKFGFVGVEYIVANRLEATNFVGVDQLKEMIKDGWEVGSHGESHLDMTLNHDYARYEILQSRLDLEDALGAPVKTFAYPYGTVDPFLAEKTQDYGYTAAVGLGSSNTHTLGSLFYLIRREVENSFDLDRFMSLLQ